MIQAHLVEKLNSFERLQLANALNNSAVRKLIALHIEYMQEALLNMSGTDPGDFYREYFRLRENLDQLEAFQRKLDAIIGEFSGEEERA